MWVSCGRRFRTRSEGATGHCSTGGGYVYRSIPGSFAVAWYFQVNGTGIYVSCMLEIWCVLKDALF